MTKAHFLEGLKQREAAGDPAALLEWGRSLDQVEDQLTNGELDAVCAGTLESALMLVGLESTDPRDFADYAGVG